MRLRGVELETPKAEEASAFLENIWGLTPVAAQGETRFFRGTGDQPYVLAIRRAAAPCVRAIEFSGMPDEIERTRSRATAAQVRVTDIAEMDAPGGGRAFVAHGPEAQTYRFIAETSSTSALAPDRDKPVCITHAVVNSVDVAASERFAVEALGFSVSDRTRIMTFIRCNRKHHALAFAHANAPSLNHIAFEMKDCDGVMRGIGRMRDAGYDAVWGPGRHGPGNNVFGYFIAPFDGVIEYTAEVSEIAEDYRVGTPEDWKWPPGRIDQWGISRKDNERIAAAERVFRFAGEPGG